MKTPLDYEQEKSLRDAAFVLRNKLESCRFFSVGVTGLLVGLILLLSAMLYFCKTASAGAFGEVGVSRFTRPAEFIWWQGPYPHEFQTDSNYFRIGYEGKPQKVLVGSVAWRASWFDLGNYKTKARATSDEALLADGRCDVSTCAPPDYYETRGSVRGLLFSGVYRKGLFFFEGGASITRQKFYIQTLVDNQKSGNAAGIIPFSPATFTWADTHTAVGYMAAVGVERKNWTASFGYWLNGKASEFYAAGNTPGIDTVKTFAVGYRF